MWGKIIGGILGYMLLNVFGGILGVVIGHSFDKGLKTAGQNNFRFHSRSDIQSTFYRAVFAVMGHIAKADGQVSQSEIAMAEEVMRQMSLTGERRKMAIDFFNEGKQADFSLDDILAELRQVLLFQPNLKRMFLEIELFAAYADGEIQADEARVLSAITHALGFSDAEYQQLENMVKAHYHGGANAAQQGPSLEDAYATLGIRSSASDSEVKKAYRRLMSQHHPDKLVSKGLPEEMIKVAEQRTHEIKAAYDVIKAERNL